VIPAAFEYIRPDTVADAVAALASQPEDAKVLAGGHSLLPLLKLRLASPATLVDIGRLPELRYIRRDGDDLGIGALTRHAELASSPVVQHGAGLLAHAASLVGDPQIRARGTIGGSLVHADPSGDLPAAVLALGGTLVLRGPGGTRSVPAPRFFTAFMQTATAPDELLVEVRVPYRPGAEWGYQKFVRRANDWAIVAVAAHDGAVALAGMGTAPLRATAVEEALRDGASASEAAVRADQGTSPLTDMHASSDYRRHLAQVLTARALVGARGRA
jgi:carbon-monoxide dehydrogenase medium subunit